MYMYIHMYIHMYIYIYYTGLGQPSPPRRSGRRSQGPTSSVEGPLSGGGPSHSLPHTLLLFVWLRPRNS